MNATLLDMNNSWDLKMENVNVKVIMQYISKFVVRLSAVLSYSFIGAAVFHYIEQSTDNDNEIKTNYSAVISNVKWRLHDNTSSAELRQLSRELNNLANGVHEIHQSKATDKYFTWVYFCLTTMMTIGYGDITPTTRNGRLFLIFYGAPGIALVIALLAFSAQIQTSLIQIFVKKITKRKERSSRSSGNSKSEDFTVFVLSVIFLIPVGVMGVLSVWYRTKWSPTNCVYYWFCTVTTIGFGDLVVSNHKAGNILPWLLMKTLTLATMAGVVNSLAVVLQKRKKINLRRNRKRFITNGNGIELK